MQVCDRLIILWHYVSLGLEGKLIFPSPVATAEFSNFAGLLSAALSQYHLLGFEIAQLPSNHASKQAASASQMLPAEHKQCTMDLRISIALE